MEIWEQSVKNQVALQDAALPHESQFELEMRNTTEPVWNKSRMHGTENQESFAIKESDMDIGAGLAKTAWFHLARNFKF